MSITILWDNDHAELIREEPAAYMKAVERIASRFFERPVSRLAKVWVNKRESSGWLEWLIVFDCNEAGNHVHGQSLTVGMIQREVGAPFEFHS